MLQAHLAASAGDDEARARGTQKTVLERVAPPTFPLVIEMRERAYWVTHWVEDSVDCLLHGKVPIVQARPRARLGPRCSLPACRFACALSCVEHFSSIDEHALASFCWNAVPFAAYSKPCKHAV